MKKELSTYSLPELQKRHNQLSTIVNERKDLFSRIGTGEIKVSSQNDERGRNPVDRIIDNRRKVKSRIAHFQEEIDLIENHVSTLPLPINVFPNADTQILGASKPEDTKEKKEIPLPVIFYDKEGKRVQVKGEEEKKFRKGAVWRIFQELLDNPGVVFSSSDLYDLALQVGQDPQSTTYTASFIDQIRRRIGKDLIKTEGKTSMSNGYYLDAQVMPFEKEMPTHFKENDAPKMKGRSRKEIVKEPIVQSRLDAISHLINNPNATFEEIGNILGPDKNGNKLKQSQIQYALIGAASLLKYKFSDRFGRERKVTDEEKEVFELVKAKSVNEDFDIFEVLRTFVRDWYMRTKHNTGFIDTVTIDTLKPLGDDSSPSIQTDLRNTTIQIPEEIEISKESINDEEIAVLSTMVSLKKDKKANVNKELITFKVPKNILDICERLCLRVINSDQHSENVKNAKYIKNRTSVLKKVAELIQKDDDSFLNNQSDDVQILLIWLFEQNDNLMAGQLFDFLDFKSNERTITDRKGTIIRHEEDIWAADDIINPATKPHESVNSTSGEAAVVHVQVTMEDAETPSIPEPEETTQSQVVFDASDSRTPESSKRRNEIETRDPNAISTIVRYILMFDEKNISFPLVGSSALARIAGIPTGEIQNAIGKKFVQPEYRNQTPIFTETQALILNYINSLGDNNLGINFASNRAQKDLAQLIESAQDEFERLKQLESERAKRARPQSKKSSRGHISNSSHGRPHPRHARS